MNRKRKNPQADLSRTNTKQAIKSAQARDSSLIPTATLEAGALPSSAAQQEGNNLVQGTSQDMCQNVKMLAKGLSILVFTDVGADADDALMLAQLDNVQNWLAERCAARNEIRGRDTIVFVSGEDPSLRQNIAQVILKDPSQYFGAVGSPSSGSRLECGSDLVEQGQKCDRRFLPARRPRTSVGRRLLVLVAAPMVGFEVADFVSPHDDVLHVVYVGNDPTQTDQVHQRGVNGGAGLTESEEIEQVVRNVKALRTMCLRSGKGSMVFLPPEMTRQVKVDTDMLAKWDNPFVTKITMEVTSSFLLGKRPSHLPLALQQRIIESNLSTMENLCAAAGLAGREAIAEGKNALPAWALERAEAYAREAFAQKKEFHSQGPELDKFVTCTARFFSLQAFVRQFPHETAEVTDDARSPLQALKQYLSALKQCNPGVCTALIPMYDCTALNALLLSWNSERVDLSLAVRFANDQKASVQEKVAQFFQGGVEPLRSDASIGLDDAGVLKRLMPLDKLLSAFARTQLSSSFSDWNL